MTLKIIGTILNPVSPDKAELIADGVLIVDDGGRIVYSGPAQQAPEIKEAEIHDYSGHLITPGFVDAHCHVGQARAANIRYSKLLPWLQNVVFPMEIAYTSQVAKREAPGFFAQLLATGTTTAGAYVTIREDSTDAVFEVARSMGIRAVIGKVMMDRHSPEGLLEETAPSVDASIRLCEKWHGAENGRLRYAFTPRFALTCSEDLMRQAGKSALEFDAHIMTHVSENTDEVARAMELFPGHRSYLEIYNDFGMLIKGGVYAHAIHLDKLDWDLVKNTGVGIVHCPTSNLALESGILDLSEPLSRGISIGLGSDIGAGYEPALAVVASSAVTSQSARKLLDRKYQSMSADLAFYMMTKGGARSLGLEDTIGELAPGKEADFVIIDPTPCLPLGEWTEDTDMPSLIWALILRFRPNAIKKVFVKGRPVFPFGNHASYQAGI